MKKSGVKRDKSVTVKRLIDAVQEEMKENGHLSLGVNRLAKRAGVDKKNIYTCFGGKEQLIVDYGKSRNLWNPIFDKVPLPKSPTSEEFKAYLKALATEMVHVFYTDGELKNVMWWNVSEENKVSPLIADEWEIHFNKMEEIGERLDIDMFTIRVLFQGIFFGAKVGEGGVMPFFELLINPGPKMHAKTLCLLIDLIWADKAKAKYKKQGKRR